MRCERCGEAAATSRVTEVVKGLAQEFSVCEKCAQTLALLEGDRGFRCSTCGVEIDDAQCIEWVRALKAKRGTFDEAAWNELVETAACPVCGNPLKLPHIPWELFADPSSAIALALLARRRPPPSPGHFPSS
jgi:protein-arginine kinase activator protein McsA